MKKAFILFIFISILSGCSDEASGPNDGGPYGADNASYDVEYSDNTRLISGSAVNTIISRDTLNPEAEKISEYVIIYEFPENFDHSNIKAGDILILENENIRKVISIKTESGKVIIETAYATLPEAIKNGRIKWDFSPKADMIKQIIINGKEEKADKILTGVEFKFEFGHNKYTIWMDPKGQSASGLLELQVNFTVENYEGVDGKLTSLLGAKGVIRIPRQSADMQFANNALTSFTSENKGMRCELTLEYICAFSPGGGQTILEFPNLTMKIPISYFTSIPIPIPIYVNIGLGFNTYLNLPSVTAWANAKAQLVFDSETGMEFNGPSVSLGAEVGGNKIEISEWEVGDMSLAPVSVEIQHDVSVPRIAIEIIGQEVAWISPVLSSRSKLIIPSLCKAQMAQIRIDGGYGLTLMGLPIFGDEKIIWEKSIELTSPECQ